MGSTCSNSSESEPEERLQKELELTDFYAPKPKPIYKILLLGTGNCGKSTLFKQLNRLYKDGIGDKEHSVRYIHDSVIHQMQRTIISCIEENEFQVSTEAQESLLYVQNLSRDVKISKEVAYHISVLWKDEKIQSTYETRSNLALADSSPYFFDDVHRLAKGDYIPTDKDLLLSRISTTGVLESEFEINDNCFDIYDNGGERSERSKWIHCFDNVNGIIYLADLSCYNQTLYEENEINAMNEAINLFGEIFNHRLFRNTPVILVLTKPDLFEERLKKSPLNEWFSDFEGKSTNSNGMKDEIEFIKSKFKEECQGNKHFHCYVLNCMEISNVKSVMKDTTNIVLDNFKTSYFNTLL